MVNEALLFVYDQTSQARYLRWVYKIARWILKKKGLLKDYEDLYKTDNSLRVLANSLKKIGVDITGLVEEEKRRIPLIFLFKKWTKHTKFTPETLRAEGFIYFAKSMCLYILPPDKVMKTP